MSAGGMQNAWRDTRRSREVDDLVRGFAEEDQVQERADVIELVEIPAFRRFLASVRGRARLDKMTYDGGSMTPMQLGYFNGRKEMAKEIMAVVDRASPEGYWRALAERRQLEAGRAARLQALVNGKEA